MGFNMARSALPYNWRETLFRIIDGAASHPAAPILPRYDPFWIQLKNKQIVEKSMHRAVILPRYDPFWIQLKNKQIVEKTMHRDIILLHYAPFWIQLKIN